MAIQNPNEVLKYISYAIGTFGAQAGGPEFQLGTAVPVPLREFEAQSIFPQSALYRDSATGKYTIAISGSNELGDWPNTNATLATENLVDALSKAG